jgi:hypothetical protein
VGCIAELVGHTDCRRQTVFSTADAVPAKQTHRTNAKDHTNAVFNSFLNIAIIPPTCLGVWVRIDHLELLAEAMQMRFGPNYQAKGVLDQDANTCCSLYCRDKYNVLSELL